MKEAGEHSFLKVGYKNGCICLLLALCCVRQSPEVLHNFQSTLSSK